MEIFRTLVEVVSVTERLDNTAEGRLMLYVIRRHE